MSDKTPVRKTPRRQPVKRAAATEERKPAKRRNTRKSDPADPSDIYNFDVNQDDHPELFKKVQVERGSFGTSRFFSTTGTKDSKYAGLEKNVTERHGGLVSEILVKTPLQSMSSGSKMTLKKSTPKSAKKSPSSKKVSQKEKAQESDNDDVMDFEDSEIDNSTKKTPVKKRGGNEAVVKTPKPKEEIPILTAEEQTKADDEKHVNYPVGARAFAIWGKEYYSAVVANRDGLGRYKVFYTEDGSDRLCPAAGIVPIYLIREGSKVTVLGEKDEDNERVVYDGKVLTVPSIESPDEWHRGLYSVEVTFEDNREPEKRDIEWVNIYLTEAQYKQIIKTKKNATNLGQENIIEGEDGKRTRRSRILVATPTVTTTPVPKSKSTPKLKAKIDLKRKETEESESAEQTDKAEKTVEGREESPKRVKKTPQNKRKSKGSLVKVDDSEPESVQMTSDVEGNEAFDEKKNGTPKVETENDEVPVLEEAVESEKSGSKRKTPQSRKKKVETPKVDAKEDEVPVLEEAVQTKKKTPQRGKKNTETPTVHTEGEVIDDEDQVLGEAVDSKEAETMNRTLQIKKKKMEIPKEDKVVADEISVSETVVEIKEAETNEVGNAESNVPKEDEKEPETRSTRSTRSTRQTKGTQDDSLVATPKSQRVTRSNKKIEDKSSKEEEQHSEHIEENQIIQGTEERKTNGDETVEDTKQAENQVNQNEEAVVFTDPKPIFRNMYFILTSANRSTGPPPFTKKDVKKAIENREGVVIENFDNILDDDKVYLIADTYYRTHKYLTALSLSIPTVNFKWIQDSVTTNKLLDYEDYMLDAGESSVDSKLHKWLPVKGKIFSGKKIAIFSLKSVTDPRVVNFREIWAPMVKNVGGIPIIDIPPSVKGVEEWFKTNEPVEYFIGDDGTPKEIIDIVNNSNCVPVTSEWLIQCIVTGEIVPESVMERYLLKTD